MNWKLARFYHGDNQKDGKMIKGGFVLFPIGRFSMEIDLHHFLCRIQTLKVKYKDIYNLFFNLSRI